MRKLLLLSILITATAHPSLAIPNSIFGGIVQADSPLNDTDITGQLLADGLWDGSQQLPGQWRAEAPVAATRYSHLLARPKAFGLPVLMCQAAHRDQELQSLTLTFADAGSYFGYYDEKLPDGLSPKDARAELLRRLTEKQENFARLYDETLESLRSQLGELADSRPRENSIGKTITLRAEAVDYRRDDLVLRLICGENRLIRLMILPGDKVQRIWLDAAHAALSSRERQRLFEDSVRRNAHGDVTLPDLPVVPQGYRPYCGLNTLAMAARYFGLHLDEDWLAVGGKFQNTGTAGGSQMLRLYQSVAKEAGLNMTRDNNFKITNARTTLRQGYPVIVWRRFSYDRNQFHTRHARAHARNPDLAIPKPDRREMESWPDDEAPVHASVIVGYNDTRNEVLFLESWAGLDFPRRMRSEELEATATMAFYFKP